MRLGPIVLAVALSSAGLAGCLASDDAADPRSTAAPASDVAGLSKVVHDTITRTGFNVTSSIDDTELHVDVYKPDAEGPFPTILVLSPYWAYAGDNKDEDVYEGFPTWYIEYFVPRGYAVALGEMRGTRSSGGCWDFGGDLDQQDGHDMVQALAAKPWSNGKVGMLGQSHVGMSQIATAITAPENLTTIVPIAAVSDWYRYLHKDGAPYVTNRATPAAYFAVHASPSTDPVTDGQPTPGWLLNQADVACPDNAIHLSQAAELDGDKDAYWQERDLIAGAGNITASVFLVHGFLDENVKTDHFLDLWEALPEDIDKRAWYGQWFHEHPFYHEWRDQLHAWFDHELKGIDNGILDAPTVTVQTSTGEARTEADWPSANTTVEAWTPYDGGLSPVTNGSQTSEVTYRSIPGDDRGEPGIPGVEQQVVFASETIESPLHIAGEPSMKLEGTLDQPTGRWIAVLFDVGPNGERDEITRAYLDARHRDGNEQGEEVPTGEPITYELSFFPRDHIVAEGHSLELVLMGGDMNCLVTGLDTCEGTGIVPVERPVTHTVTTGPGSPTRLHLPLLEAPGPAFELTELDGWLEDAPE